MQSRYWGVAVLAAGAMLAACGGGSGGGSGGGTGGGGGSDPINCDGTGSVTISGVATYEDVPPSLAFGGSLDYSNSVMKPIRQAQVFVECADGSQIYSETTTDEAGNFSASAPENVDARIVVRARSVKLTGGATWDFDVVDNTNGQAVWALEGDRFDTGAGAVVDIEALSGWDMATENYTGDRTAGAFAIFDTVYDAMQLVIATDPAVAFEALTVNWSPDNRSTCRGSGLPLADGCLGSSFYTQNQIFILGKEDDDTDEYDDSVVAHEWGHYFEDTLARSDSIGGSHGGGDALDIRVAFGEGFGNAFSGMVTGMTNYIDASGSNQRNGFRFGLETQAHSPEGWYSEFSVQLVLFDLFDANSDGGDSLTLGWGPLYNVLTGSQRTTEAFTSIFSMTHYLVQDEGVSSVAMSTLLADNGIAPVTDIWGSNRTNLGPSASTDQYTSPPFIDLTNAVNTGSTVQVCVTDAYEEYNRLGNRRFGYFTVNTNGTYSFTLDGSVSGIAGSDPDIVLYVDGVRVDESTVDSSGTGIEQGNFDLSVGTTYVVDLHDWLNINRDNADGGQGCLEFTATL